MLDSRVPQTQIAEDESRIEEQTEKEIQQLMHDTRLWRVANSAQWVAWGIVQAKVEGMDEALENQRNTTHTQQDSERVEDEKQPLSPQSPDAGKHTGTSHLPHLGSDPLDSEMANLALDAKDKRREEGEGEDEEEEFDYLAYAQDRAMFFWGDVLALGVVGRKELPEELLNKVKVVDY